MNTYEYLKFVPSILLYVMYNYKIDRLELTPEMLEDLYNQGYFVYINEIKEGLVATLEKRDMSE